MSKLIPRTANLVNEWLEDWRVSSSHCFASVLTRMRQAGSIQPDFTQLPPMLANKPPSWLHGKLRIRGLRDLGGDTWGVILDIWAPPGA
jgi:hypothetical protein